MSQSSLLPRSEQLTIKGFSGPVCFSYEESRSGVTAVGPLSLMFKRLIDRLFYGVSMDLERCARCGSLAQVHIWPDAPTIQYVVDCVNHNCPRRHETEPKYGTREEAVAGWNKRQRSKN